MLRRECTVKCTIGKKNCKEKDRSKAESDDVGEDGKWPEAIVGNGIGVVPPPRRHVRCAYAAVTC